MKVAVIEPVCAQGGMDYYDFSLLRSLMRKGCKARLYTSKAGTMPHDDIEVREFFRGVYGSAPASLRALIWVIALVRSLLDAKLFGAHIAHFHFYGYNPIYPMSIRISKIMGVKVVATVHDVESYFAEYGKGKISRLLLALDGIIVHNEATRIELMRFLQKEQKETIISVISHGHYLDYIGREREKVESRKKLNLPVNCKIFLFFGRIRKAKGLDTAIRAVFTLKEKFPKVLLLVAGKMLKNDFSDYEALIRELGVEENVKVNISYIPPKDVDDYYYASNAVLLPYRKVYQSGVLLMSMSYGIPVIASGLPGMRDVITDEKNGLLFPVDDHLALADAMRRVAENVDFAEELGRNGKKYVRHYHDWKVIGEKTAAFYRNVSGASTP